MPGEQPLDGGGYFDPEKIEMEKRPLEMIPFYEVGH